MYAISKDTTETGRKTGTTHGAVMRQRTLKTAITCTGVGLHTGNRISMTLQPAEIGTGIVFRRIDIAGSGAVIPAHWGRVVDTRMCTVVSNDNKVSVGTIEHLLAAFAGAGVDNAMVEINGPEVPVMDGSAAPFLFLMECAGIAEQDAPRRAIKILKKVVVQDGDKTAALYPASSGFAIDFEIAFAAAAVARQSYGMDFSSASFSAEISRARTFGFLEEVAQLQAMGLARGGSLDNAVVVSGDRILNEEGLRFDDEFVRHKILDAIGDLNLAGHPIIGRFFGHCSGHALNNRLLRQLFADATAWTLVDLTPAAAETSPRWHNRLPRIVAHG
ncbi:MAG: UDP-3-O-acyl-N-acetylglucosamine deacetylase [Alphaproteobacteria bacterium]